MIWSYGVTTVSSRLATTLPGSLQSIANAGFDKPRLFIDDCCDGDSYAAQFGLEVTSHYPKLNVAGNWILTLWELYLRNPLADRFAVFQDDILACANLRAYLEKSPYPDNGYLNLYTSPSNQDLATLRASRGTIVKGWYESNQLGRGALGLVFNRPAVVTLLKAEHLVAKPQDPFRGWRTIDGGISDSFRNAGWKEYVHNPSLIQHVGRESSYDKRKKNFTKDGQHPTFTWPSRWQAPSFPGEGFNALDLLSKS